MCNENVQLVLCQYLALVKPISEHDILQISLLEIAKCVYSLWERNDESILIRVSELYSFKNFVGVLFDWH